MKERIFKKGGQNADKNKITVLLSHNVESLEERFKSKESGCLEPANLNIETVAEHLKLAHLFHSKCLLTWLSHCVRSSHINGIMN